MILKQLNNSQTVKTFFQNGYYISIPDFHNGYSWNTKQCSTFFNNIKNSKSENYNLGQFLFEKESEKLFVIDGKHRLTSIILLLSAITKTKRPRGLSNTDQIREIYLTDVFKTKDSDQLIFKEITQTHSISSKNKSLTISQKRIIDAFNYFETELNKLESPDIFLIEDTIEHAILSSFYITNKEDASQILSYLSFRKKQLDI